VSEGFDTNPGLFAMVARLRGRVPLPALFPPQPWRAWEPGLNAQIEAMGLAAPVRAGLLLWNDALAESHAVSQGIEGATGAYWHGIMHRREGDLDNAGHWFRRTGAHPVCSEVQAAALSITEEAFAAGNRWAGERRADLEAAGVWDPFRFAAWCGATRGSAGPHPVLERIQLAEIEALLRHSAGPLGPG
jgi:hypothetical protein